MCFGQFRHPKILYIYNLIYNNIIICFSEGVGVLSVSRATSTLTLTVMDMDMELTQDG